MMKGMAFEKDGEDRVQLMSPLVGTFLIGPLYFLVCRAYVPAAIYFGITLFTAGIGWLILPFCAEAILRGYYKSRGWKQADYMTEGRDCKTMDGYDLIILSLLAGMLIGIAGIVALMMI